MIEINLAYHRPIQLAILGALWRDKALTFDQIRRVVCREYKPLAASTISTTLTRMVKQGWLERPDHGWYKAAVTREALIATITQAIEEA